MISNTNKDKKIMKNLTRLSIENLLHPFQTFVLGQKKIKNNNHINFNKI